MEVIQLLLLAFLPALVIVAGLKDLTSMKIPNWISGLLILGFVPAALLVGLAPIAMAIHLGVGVAALLISRAWLRPYVDAGPGWLVQLMEPKGHIPYGVAIAAGALVAWPASPLMVAFLGG